MDIEQLRLILEAAAAAGDGATRVVFVWFAYKFFGTLVHYGLFGGLFFAAYKVASRCISAFAFREAVGNILGYDYLSNSRKDAFIQWLRETHPDAKR